MTRTLAIVPDDVERAIVGLVWHEDSERVEITYAEGGEPDSVTGAREVIEALARDIGLTVVESAEGTVRWAKVTGREIHDA